MYIHSYIHIYLSGMFKHCLQLLNLLFAMIGFDINDVMVLSVKFFIRMHVLCAFLLHIILCVIQYVILSCVCLCQCEGINSPCNVYLLISALS